VRYVCVGLCVQLHLLPDSRGKETISGANQEEKRGRVGAGCEGAGAKRGRWSRSGERVTREARHEACSRCEYLHTTCAAAVSAHEACSRCQYLHTTCAAAVSICTRHVQPLSVSAHDMCSRCQYLHTTRAAAVSICTRHVQPLSVSAHDTCSRCQYLHTTRAAAVRFQLVWCRRT
jgi:hypothetical protein